MSISNVNNVEFFAIEGKTKNGVIFDPNKDIWNIHDTNKKIIINFDKLQIDSSHIYGLKNVFKWYLSNVSVTHTINMFEQLKGLMVFLYEESNKNIYFISEIDLINYRSYLGINKEWYLGALSGFLTKWYKMGYKCVTSKAYGYLKEIKIKGNQKGRAVLTMCPIHGPFSDFELENIQDKIKNIYAENNITINNYLLVWLFMIYGSRPIQLAQLKVKDVISIKREDGSFEVIINIPRAKNRKKARSEFKKRLVPKGLSELLTIYREDTKKQFIGNLNNPDDAPLFFNKNKEDNEHGYDLQYHLTSAEIKQKLDSVFNKLNIISERTGKKLHITPTRFRRTVGTRAAAEGHGELIIAEILDHTDIQNVGVYVQSTPEIIERIDKVVAMQMAPLAQAFSGVLLKDKSKAIRANDPNADIIDPLIDQSYTPNGKCGSYSFCESLSPIACYTCSSFQAWIDGPHEKVLMHLLKERERLLETTDYRIASINDKSIVAVAQVVLACKEHNDSIDNTIEVLK
jgi:integrase